MDDFLCKYWNIGVCKHELKIIISKYIILKSVWRGRIKSFSYTFVFISCIKRKRIQQIISCTRSLVFRAIHWFAPSTLNFHTPNNHPYTPSSKSHPQRNLLLSSTKSNNQYPRGNRPSLLANNVLIDCSNYNMIYIISQLVTEWSINLLNKLKSINNTIYKYKLIFDIKIKYNSFFLLPKKMSYAILN